MDTNDNNGDELAVSAAPGSLNESLSSQFVEHQSSFLSQHRIPVLMVLVFFLLITATNLEKVKRAEMLKRARQAEIKELNIVKVSDGSVDQLAKGVSKVSYQPKPEVKNSLHNTKVTSKLLAGIQSKALSTAQKNYEKEKIAQKQNSQSNSVAAVAVKQMPKSSIEVGASNKSDLQESISENVDPKIEVNPTKGEGSIAKGDQVIEKRQDLAFDENQEKNLKTENQSETSKIGKYAWLNIAPDCNEAVGLLKNRFSALGPYSELPEANQSEVDRAIGYLCSKKFQTGRFKDCDFEVCEANQLKSRALQTEMLALYRDRISNRNKLRQAMMDSGRGEGSNKSKSWQRFTLEASIPRPESASPEVDPKPEFSKSRVKPSRAERLERIKKLRERRLQGKVR